VLPGLSITDNLIMSSLGRDRFFGPLLSRRHQARRAETLIEDFDVRISATPSAPIESLSGGNQQKVIIGRILCTGKRLFVLDDPTVGVDVGAKEEIYDLIDQAAADGAGFLMYSSDPSELALLCDTIVLIQDGSIAGTVDRQSSGNVREMLEVFLEGDI
jgi:ribose transport system ATP-binding protein